MLLPLGVDGVPARGGFRARIEELHRAGRSTAAISKELGVPYNTVYRHVKALGDRAPS